MADFLIINKSTELKSNKLKDWGKINNNVHSIYFKNDKSLTFDRGKLKILIIGDFWNEDVLGQKTENYEDFETIIKTLKGNYYYFIIESDKIQLITGFLNLCPVFYSAKFDFATSNYELLKDFNYEYSINDRYILESFLFNYAFFNSTIYQDIYLLSTHHVLNLTNHSIAEEKFWDITTLIIDKPVNSKKSHNDLCEKFIKTTNEYVPEKEAAITFTSGFDGRTIVAVSLYLKKKFTCLSFGKSENDDVKVPLINSKELKIPFIHFDAEDNIYKNTDYQNCANEITIQSGGFNGFLYPHFLYIAKQLSAKHNYLITGYGGSELLRSTHITGAITSKALYQVISINDREELKKEFLKNEALLFLSQDLVKNNLDGLLDDLMNYKVTLIKHNTLNKKLYAFILNETFRKVFGVWQSSQAKYINVRAPYFDFDFVNALFKTNLAGIYNDFYTKNPLKRFKGQLLYALIINKTNKLIANQNTGKGYKPINLLSLTGKFKIIKPFITKRVKRNVSRENLDNLSIITGVKNFIASNPANFDSRYFNNKHILTSIEKLDPYCIENNRDLLLNSISLNKFINEF